MSGLTLEQKKIIIEYGLGVRELSALDDFAVLERLDRQAHDHAPEPEFLLPKCFSDGLTAFPSDAAVDRHLGAERAAFEAMRRYAESAEIPWIDVPASGYSRSAAVAELARATVRDDGAFGTAVQVDLDTAERMLRAGEARLSGFGRWCPVRTCDRPDSVQQYYADARTGRVHPVVHRKYVYYLSGPENRDKFVSEPLKYVAFDPRSTPYRTLKNLCAPPADVPLRIAVVGPPRSGKSYLAEMLCAQHGFQLIRVEQAVESYLSEYGWTDGAKSAAQQLRRGDALSDATLAEAVNAATYAERAVVQGFVLDGFPVTEKQFGHMDGLGVIMHRVFVVDSDRGHADDDEVSEALLRRRRQSWTAGFVGESWITERYGNVTMTRDYGEMEASVRECVTSLRQYRADVYEDRPCSLANVPVTEPERRDRVSSFLDLCPVCRLDDNCLSRPADAAAAKHHLVQYRFHFYWVCPRHGDAFAADPDAYADAAPPEDPGPELLPELITEDEASENPYVQCRNVSAYCVVCAIGGDRLWSPAYRRGKSALMASYSKYVFAFCSPACRAEFARRPFLYARYRMRARGPEPDTEQPPAGSHPVLAVRDLPVLGFLEQTVGPPAEAALEALLALRPVYPGHSAAVSAALFLGLHVGAHGRDEDLNEYYRNLYALFVQTCRDFKMASVKLKLAV